MSNAELTAEMTDSTWTVKDASGSRWWPSEESERLIAAASDPAAEAVRLAAETGAGDWKF